MLKSENLIGAYTVLQSRLSRIMQSCENEEKELVLLKLKIQTKTVKKQLEFLSFFVYDNDYDPDDWLCMSYGYAINAILTEVRNKCTINRLDKASTMELIATWSFGMGLDYDWVKNYLKKLFNVKDTEICQIVDKILIKE